MQAGAGVGQLDAAGEPSKQNNPQILLQLLDLPADRAVCHAQFVSGFAEAQQGRRGVERL